MNEHQKDGGVALLDWQHFAMDNGNGKPFLGWLPASEGVGGLVNKNGWAALRTALWKLADGKAKWLYDQFMLVENPGAVVIAHDKLNRVALTRCFRMTGERLIRNAGSSYIRMLQEEQHWKELFESLGEWKWEAPRGLVSDETVEDWRNFVIRSAKIEAKEEAGLEISDARLAGRINPNSTFFAHPQWVVNARIRAIGYAQPEDLEILGKTQLFSLEQLREMADSGELDDGLTLGGLALCGISF